MVFTHVKYVLGIMLPVPDEIAYVDDNKHESIWVCEDHVTADDGHGRCGCKNNGCRYFLRSENNFVWSCCTKLEMQYVHGVEIKRVDNNEKMPFSYELLPNEYQCKVYETIHLHETVLVYGHKCDKVNVWALQDHAVRVYEPVVSSEHMNRWCELVKNTRYEYIEPQVYLILDDCVSCS